MRDVEALLDVVANIYSVPGNPDNWTGVLQRISDHLGGAAAGYLLIDAETHATEIGGQWGFTDEHKRAYQGMQDAGKDVRFKYMHRLVPGRAMYDFEHVPDRAEYEANEWIRYERATLGVSWYLVALISPHGLWHDVITVNRLHERGPYDEDSRAGLQALLPHLARTAELHRTMSRLQESYGAVLAVLDKLLVGLAIVDAAGRVAIVNEAARRACARSGALRVTPDGRLRAWQADADAALQMLIADTGETVGGRGSSDGGSVVLASRTPGSAILAEVVPLRDDGFSDGDRLRGSAVFILDPDHSHVLSLDGLARIFGLTPAEHAVATDLVNGADPKRIAETMNKSVETVRSQLKAIFSKTGARSQLDLLRLAVKADPPVEGQARPRADE